MGTIASQITSLTIVYSTVYSDADQRKHQSSASLAFVWGIHREPVNSPHKWPVTRNLFPFDDVIMNLSAWASCQIRKFAGAHAPGMPGTFSPSPQVSDPDMHHGTCVTHVPWCMPGSLISGFLWNRRWGKTFPAFPAHAQPAILRIW